MIWTMTTAAQVVPSMLLPMRPIHPPSAYDRTLRRTLLQGGSTRRTMDSRLASARRIRQKRLSLGRLALQLGHSMPRLGLSGISVSQK